MTTTISNPLRKIVLAAMVLSMAACATTLQSTVDQADHAEFDAYKTYAWISDSVYLSDITAPDVAQPLNASRIRDAVNSELFAKGYRQVDRADADLVVSARLGANDRVRVREYYDTRGFSYYGAFPRFSRFGGFGRFDRFSPRVDVDTFTEGVLVIDVFEGDTKQAIWHGAAKKRLSKQTMPKDLIDEAVMNLFESFPGTMG